MARSTYIYVVTDGLGVVGAYTIKHELAAWLHANPASDHQVTRVRHGAHSRKHITLLDVAACACWVPDLKCPESTELPA